MLTEFNAYIKYNKALHESYVAILIQEKKNRVTRQQRLITLNKILQNIEETREMYRLYNIVPRSYFSDSNQTLYYNQQTNIENAISSINFNNAEQERISYVCTHVRIHNGEHIYTILYSKLTIFNLENNINSVITDSLIMSCIHIVFYNIKKVIPIRKDNIFYRINKTQVQNIAYLYQLIKWYKNLNLDTSIQYQLFHVLLFIEMTILNLSKNKRCSICTIYNDLAISRFIKLINNMSIKLISPKTFRIESKLLFDAIMYKSDINTYIGIKILRYII